MHEYLFWSGVALNVTLASFLLLVIWVWFIWPFVEAVSIASVAREAKIKSGEKPAPGYAFVYFRYWYGDLIFGRNWTRISNRQFEWSGVGKYRIYADENYQE